MPLPFCCVHESVEVIMNLQNLFNLYSMLTVNIKQSQGSGGMQDMNENMRVNQPETRSPVIPL